MAGRACTGTVQANRAATPSALLISLENAILVIIIPSAWYDKCEPWLDCSSPGGLLPRAMSYSQAACQKLIAFIFNGLLFLLEVISRRVVKYFDALCRFSRDPRPFSAGSTVKGGGRPPSEPAEGFHARHPMTPWSGVRGLGRHRPKATRHRCAGGVRVGPGVPLSAEEPST